MFESVLFENRVRLSVLFENCVLLRQFVIAWNVFEVFGLCLRVNCLCFVCI